MLVLDWQHLVGLFVLAIPIACIARTVVFEEVLREPREWCQKKSESCRRLLTRKFFYLFTCEYCFSHWVTLAALLVTGYRLMYADWKGFVIAFFSLVFVANAYLNLYSRLRVDITSEKKQIEATEHEIEAKRLEIETMDREARRLDTGIAERRAEPEGNGQAS
jgi:cell division protein FtsB